MKEAELATLGKCCVCGEPMLGHSKSTPTFYTITVAHHGFDIGALQRRIGLGNMVGSDRIARALGPDEDLAKQVGDESKFFVHETCANEDFSVYYLLFAKANETDN